jgi:ubiquinone/menaquinone biosynthesis C-methylase UbiE
MRRFEALRGEVAVLRQFLRGMPREGAQDERLGAFYGPQAAHYDRFRERLLQGRAELIAALELAADAHVVELGAGTGRNLEFFPEPLRQTARFTLVDLCRPLLEQARHRTRDMDNVAVIHADATRVRPPAPADCVLLSYALTMIPDWRGAIDNALAMLRRGGQLAVVDFHVSAREPPPGQTRHGALARAFWPRWFGHDGVCLDPDHLPTLAARCPDHVLVQASAALPYLPLLRVPYFRFVGRRR